MNPGLRQICAAVAMLNIVLIGCGNKTTPQESNNQQAVVNRTLADQAAPIKKSSEGALKKRAEIYFDSMLRESGIDFRHVSGNSGEKAFPAANGSGLAAFDADMDGYVDLYFGNGAQFRKLFFYNVASRPAWVEISIFGPPACKWITFSLG